MSGRRLNSAWLQVTGIFTVCWFNGMSLTKEKSHEWVINRGFVTLIYFVFNLFCDNCVQKGGIAKSYSQQKVVLDK